MLGMHPEWRHSPPTRSRSISAVLAPDRFAAEAATRPAEPAPMTQISYSFIHSSPLIFFQGGIPSYTPIPVLSGDFEKKRISYASIWFSRMHHRIVLFPSKESLQQERDNGNDHEDYHEPFCDFHRETGYPPCPQNKGNQGEYKENYRKIDEISHCSPHIYFFFNFDTASCAAILASATALWTPIFTSSDPS